MVGGDGQSLLGDGEVEHGRPVIGDGDLRAFHRDGEPVSALVLDDPHEPSHEVGPAAVALEVQEIAHHLGLVEPVDRRPRGEVVVGRGRHRQTRPLQRTAEPEQGHDDAQAEQAVEVRAADPDAVVGEDVGRAVGPAHALRPEAHDREVRGAAADVGDQSELLAPDLGLVVEARGDRLVLEGDLRKARLARDLAQRLLGTGVRRRVVVDEVDGAAVHEVGDLAPQRRLGAALHAADVGGDDRPESQSLTADQRGLLDQRGSPAPTSAPASAARAAHPRRPPRRPGRSRARQRRAWKKKMALGMVVSAPSRGRRAGPFPVMAPRVVLDVPKSRPAADMRRPWDGAGRAFYGAPAAESTPFAAGQATSSINPASPSTTRAPVRVAGRAGDERRVGGVPERAREAGEAQRRALRSRLQEREVGDPDVRRRRFGLARQVQGSCPTALIQLMPTGVNES